MGMLAGTALFLIQHVIPQLHRKHKTLGISRMLMNWNIDDLAKHLQNNNIEFNHAIAEKIRSRGPIYTSKDFFELLGFDDYQDVDIDPSTGCSIIHDLNQPLPKKYENCFDFIIENGTIEHIFDIKAVMGNIAKSVKVGGTICHISPLDAFNHGFYNFSVNFLTIFIRPTVLMRDNFI
jgi:SAM-dependent methyltransferase